MAHPPLSFDYYDILTDDQENYIKLGDGAMGIVFKARHRDLNTYHAVKVIKNSLVATNEAREHFREEARAAANINHPNVVRVVHSGVRGVDCFYVMEFIDGESIQQRLHRGGPLAAGEALELLRAVADALGALEEAKLVHRDIKPANIMVVRDVSRRNRIKLIDFGLVKPARRSGQAPSPIANELNRNRIVGTAPFASPEQFIPEAELDSRSDFYSLGATLWCALTGYPPSWPEKDFARWHRESEPAWGKIASLPDTMQKLMRSLLAKNVADRPENAHALIELWDAALVEVKAQDIEPLPWGGGPTHDDPAGTLPEDAATPPERPRAGGVFPQKPSSTVPDLQSPVVSPPRQPSPVSTPFVPPAVPLREPPPAAPSGRSPIAAPREPLPLDWESLKPSPQGYALPPKPAKLARELPTGKWLAIRDVPAELSKEVLQYARVAADARNPGLLNVRAVTNSEVASEWAIGITAARLLAQHPGKLPLVSVLDWSRKAAETVDWACDRGLARLGLDPRNWLISFDALGQDETPEEHAKLSPGKWGKCDIRLDPLAGFDPILLGASIGDATAPIDLPISLNRHEDYLAAFARTLHELLGGKRDNPSPLAGLERSSAILLAAMAGKATTTRVSDWSVAFEQAARTDQPKSAPSAPAPALTQPPLKLAPTPQPLTASAIEPQTNPLAWRSGITRRAAAWTFAGLVAVAACVCLIHWRKPNQASTPTPRPTPIQARGTPTPTIAPVRVVSIEDATNKPGDHFINTLQMEFVPVPIVGGPSNGKRVLFSIWDTRVEEFEAFVNATRFAGTEGETETWKNPGFAQNGSFPVVYVNWQDARAFCEWLTQKEHKNKLLPPTYSYRLPFDYEWSCAVGIGNMEDPKASPKENHSKSTDAYPWGETWPPPNGEGNYAGASQSPSPAGCFKPNLYGLFDMAGNVSQWCEDKFSTSAEENFRVFRGSSWASTERDQLRSASRGHSVPAKRSPYVGFRCVIALSAP